MARDPLNPTFVPRPRSPLPAADVPDVTVNVYEDNNVPLFSRISWSAVFAGVAVALAVNLLLNLLGAGIGLSTVDAVEGETPGVAAFTTMGAFWYLISGLIASFAGGYTAATLSGRIRPSTYAWHGLVTWAATLLVVAVLMANAVGGAIGGAARGIGHMASGLTHGAAAVGFAGTQSDGPALDGRSRAQVDGVQAGVMDALRNGSAGVNSPMGNAAMQVRELTSGSNSPAELREVTMHSVQALLAAEPAAAQVHRDRAVAALARTANMSTQEAAARIDVLEQEYRRAAAEAEQRARAAADAAAKTVAATAILGAIGLMLGAFFGWLGGLTAVPGRGFSLNPFIRRSDRVVM